MPYSLGSGSSALTTYIGRAVEKTYTPNIPACKPPKKRNESDCSYFMAAYASILLEQSPNAVAQLADIDIKEWRPLVFASVSK